MEADKPVPSGEGLPEACKKWLDEYADAVARACHEQAGNLDDAHEAACRAAINTAVIASLAAAEQRGRRKAIEEELFVIGCRQSYHEDEIGKTDDASIKAEEQALADECEYLAQSLRALLGKEGA